VKGWRRSLSNVGQPYANGSPPPTKKDSDPPKVVVQYSYGVRLVPRLDEPDSDVARGSLIIPPSFG
jgi:hypothetical protein